MSCGHCGIPRSEIDPEAILKTLPRLFEELKKVVNLNGKEGVMFCLKNKRTGKFTIPPTEIGKITNGREEKYTDLCQEKADRLAENSVSQGHCLSWQSQDPDNDKYPGGIDDGDEIWSCSGLTGEQDEALMIMGAHSCGRITNGAPEIFAKISDNRVILDNKSLFWIHKG